MSTDFMNLQVTLQISLRVSRLFFLTGVSLAGNSKVKTEHLTLRTTDAHFSRVASHVTVAQDFYPRV